MPEYPPGDNPRMIYQVDETRTRILDSARSLFTENGLFQTRMKDIAGDCGISRASLYRYYQDKSDLALAVLEQIAGGTAGDDPGFPEDDSVTGLDRIEEHLKKRWLNPGRMDEYRYFAEFDAFFSGSRLPEGFTERLEAVFSGEPGDRLLGLIREGQDDGSVRGDLDPHLTMVTLINGIRGLQQRLLLRGNALVEVRGGELKDMVSELLKYCISGIAAGPVADRENKR
jgi:AcrR family transcriptional regulator